MSSTVLLLSSSRRHGNTGQLTDRVAGELDALVIDLAQKNISAFDYDHGNRGDDFESLMDEVLTYDNIVFASPVYWYAMTPAMKTFFDRITDYLDLEDLRDSGRKLRGKKAFVICTSIHAQADDSFLGTFRKTFAYLGMSYGGCLHLDCRDGYSEELIEHDIDAFTRLINDEHMNKTNKKQGGTQ